MPPKVGNRKQGCGSRRFFRKFGCQLFLWVVMPGKAKEERFPMEVVCFLTGGVWPLRRARWRDAGCTLRLSDPTSVSSAASQGPRPPSALRLAWYEGAARADLRSSRFEVSSGVPPLFKGLGITRMRLAARHLDREVRENRDDAAATSEELDAK